MVKLRQAILGVAAAAAIALLRAGDRSAESVRSLSGDPRSVLGAEREVVSRAQYFGLT